MKNEIEDEVDEIFKIIKYKDQKDIINDLSKRDNELIYSKYYIVDDKIYNIKWGLKHGAEIRDLEYALDLICNAKADEVINYRRPYALR